jgi:hypothetical protein
MLPADASIRERTFWAGMAAIVGIAHDGSERTNDVTRFQRIEAACATFGVHGGDRDRLLRRFGFHYHRPSDCYLDRPTWELMTLLDAQQTPGLQFH